MKLSDALIGIFLIIAAVIISIPVASFSREFKVPIIA
jgi:hypothetical protein